MIENKEKYESLIIEVVRFEVTDVVTASSNSSGGGSYSYRPLSY